MSIAELPNGATEVPVGETSPSKPIPLVGKRRSRSQVIQVVLAALPPQFVPIRLINQQTNLSYYLIKECLVQLQKEGKAESRLTGTRTFWRRI